MATELTRTPLAIYMAGHLYDAAADMPTTTPAELYERFLSWTRSGTQAPGS